MEELDLKELFGIFWAKKVQIVLIILIFMVIGIIYTVGFTTPKYSAETTLILASQKNEQQNSNTITTSTSTELTVNSKLVSTYSELIKSKNVIRQVIANLNLGNSISEEELKNNITVTQEKDTEIIKISVSNENATSAAKLANETAKVFMKKITELYNINNIQIVDEAEIQTTPSNINHPKDIMIFAFIGIVVAVGYVLVANMLDTTIKSSEEVEKLCNVPVIASIPLYSFEIAKNKGGKRRR